MTASIPGVLLTNGWYYGTLAAARCFGRQGLDVTIADASPRGVVQSSRYVSRHLACPERLDFDGMARWLESYGRRHPGTLLYPCSDDLVWIIAHQRERLAPHFTLLQPPFRTIETLLDKHKLYTLCEALHIPVPQTIYPAGDDDLEAIVSRLDGAYLVKPKTQAGLDVTRKSELALAGPHLLKVYRDFLRNSRYTDAVLRHDPSLAWPMLQAFNPTAATQTLSVAGFRSADGDFFAAVCSRKALQYPLRIGTGLCFESVPINPVVIERVERLCQAVGYFGAFEVEFIRGEGDYDLMDFNPRFYGQMQLEISRGLPIPSWVVSAASGAGLPASTAPTGPARLSHRSLLKLIMTTQWLAGRVTTQERRHWLNFVSDASMPLVDHVRDADDPGPWLADWRLRIATYCRHPRSSLKTLFGGE